MIPPNFNSHNTTSPSPTFYALLNTTSKARHNKSHLIILGRLPPEFSYLHLLLVELSLTYRITDKLSKHIYRVLTSKTKKNPTDYNVFCPISPCPDRNVFICHMQQLFLTDICGKVDISNPHSMLTAQDTPAPASSQFVKQYLKTP